jgi:hypothetical protein
VEGQYCDKDIRVIPGDVSREGYKNQRDEQENVNPEQPGIDKPHEIELAVMTQPKTCKNQK